MVVCALLRHLEIRLQKGRQAQTSIYLPVETLEKLKALSKRTRIPMAAYLREAVDDLLKKYDARGRGTK